ncbi:MAG: PHP domain-containing protein [Eubacterium sp.]
MIDLHTHSTFSDGSCSPTELVRLASKIGLSAVALTDRNTISVLEEFDTIVQQKICVKH